MSNSPISEHDVEAYLRVKTRLQKLDGGMKVESEGPLTEALEKLFRSPLVMLATDELDPTCPLSIAGEAAGTLEKPNVDLILQHSTPSSFGKGEQTVMDPTYRNGREIPAAAIGLGQWKTDPVADFICDNVSAAMFIGRKVELKLYKLAIYAVGGHFDWHMDSTHSDMHHATVLVALNTSWEGGDLVLRRDGVETRVDMRPKILKGTTDEIVIQAVAFYTDTEHKVEPVTDGVRIVLQYDVEVTGDENEQGDDYDSVLEAVEKRHAIRDQQSELALGSHGGDKAVVTNIINIIEELLKHQDVVAFALQHLHRKSSIMREYLKGADALVYEALVDSGLFDVSLRPVLFHEQTDYEGSYEGTERTFACPYDKIPADDEEVNDNDKKRKRATKNPNVFYVNKASAIKLISAKEYLEHTGNEAQFGEHKYFGGGMFVRLRNTRGKTGSEKSL